MVGEFICGNDMSTNIDKLRATLRSIANKAAESTCDGGSYGMIQNTYSDDQLDSTIQDTKGTLVLKLYREGCKKCAALEPIFVDLSREPQYQRFYWMQADVGNIGTYTKKIKERLLGMRPTDTAIENCDMCNNTGFIPCANCHGQGVVTKGQFTVVCPTCVGYKKLRCPKCGGKCLKCVVDDSRSD